MEVSGTWILVVAAALVFAIGFAMMMFGLWLGEKRSKETLENVADYGKTRRPEARDLTPPDPETEAKKRAEMEAVNNQIERLADEIQERGQDVSRERAKREARNLLSDAYEKAGGGA